MSVRYLCAFFTVLGFAGSRALSRTPGRSALCDLISESFVPARVLGCSLEALQRAVYLCAVRPPAGCGDPVASSLAGRDWWVRVFQLFAPGLWLSLRDVRDHSLDPRE